MKKSNVIAALTLAATMVVTQSSVVMAQSVSQGQTGKTGSSFARATAGQMLKGQHYAKNELIVTFDDSMKKKNIRDIVEKRDAEVERIVTVDDEKAAKITIAEGDTMKAAIQKFQQDPRVVSVQPNYRYQIRETGADPCLSPDSVNYQYVNDEVKAEAAWSFLENGGKKAKTRVAVLDTGVDARHEDLQENLVEGLGKGTYVQTISGEEIVTKDDSGEHGTHVSGIIGATYNNGIGGSGVAAGHNNDLVEVMTVGTSPDGMYLYTFDIVNAVDFAIRNGARVMNMSFGMNARDRVEEKVLMDAYYNHGVVLVAASGNEDFNGYSDPGSMKEVIGVNASTITHRAAYYSNYGYSSDISAPGSEVLSTIPGDKYAKFSGTSMASPVTAGIVALMLDANPDLTPQQLYNVLCASTGEEFDKTELAYGIIDAEKAVKAAAEASASVPAESLFMKESSVTIPEGDDYALETLVRPATSLAEVTWASSDESVATVDENGRVIGISEGNCEITATVGEFSKTCKVTVEPTTKAESISISGDTEIELGIDEYTGITVKILPTGASNQEVYYESSNPEIAMVDEVGGITGISRGHATITAYTYVNPADYLKDPESAQILKATVEVEVKYPGSKIEFTESKDCLHLGETFTFGAALTDGKGHYGDEVVGSEIVWSVINKGVASIDEKTGELTPKKAGTVWVVAKQAGVNEDEEEVVFKAVKKVVIAKDKYSGKADYALKQAGKTKTSVTLKWKKVPPADGYVVESAAKKAGKYRAVKTINSGSTVKAKINTKKAGYYRVRAYYEKDGVKKFYGYSNVIQAKPSK